MTRKPLPLFEVRLSIRGAVSIHVIDRDEKSLSPYPAPRKRKSFSKVLREIVVVPDGVS